MVNLMLDSRAATAAKSGRKHPCARRKHSTSPKPAMRSRYSWLPRDPPGPSSKVGELLKSPATIQCLSDSAASTAVLPTADPRPNIRILAKPHLRHINACKAHPVQWPSRAVYRNSHQWRAAVRHYTNPHQISAKMREFFRNPILSSANTTSLSSLPRTRTAVVNLCSPPLL